VTSTTREPSGPVFERANDRIDRLLAKPDVAAAVAAARAARTEMNRAYAEEHRDDPQGRQPQPD
jgi:hypothetical protein